MSKNILDFLSSYEDELNSQAAFYEKSISRIESQIKDTKNKLLLLRKILIKNIMFFRQHRVIMLTQRLILLTR